MNRTSPLPSQHPLPHRHSILPRVTIEQIANAHGGLPSDPPPPDPLNAALRQVNGAAPSNIVPFAAPPASPTTAELLALLRHPAAARSCDGLIAVSASDAPSPTGQEDDLATETAATIENQNQCLRSIGINPATLEPLPARLTPAEEQHIRTVANGDRNTIIAALRKALKDRSGRAWSVTGSTGTAYGWITIDAPPARRTAHCRLKAGAVTTDPEDYEMVETGEPDGSMAAADSAELSRLLGLDVHHQGHSIPASTDYRRVALCRALHGHPGPFTAEPYWD